MIDIEGCYLELWGQPEKGDLQEIESAEGLKILELNSAEKIGPEWAKVASTFERAGVKELRVFFLKNSRDYSWLTSFRFVQELWLKSDFLPKREDLECFDNLTGIALGNHKSGPVKNLADVTWLSNRLKWLTLTGAWKDCSKLAEFGPFETLSFSSFKGDCSEMLKFVNAQNLTIHDSNGLDLSYLPEVKRLKKLVIYSEKKAFNLPDMTGCKDLKSVELLTPKKMNLDYSKIFAKSVQIEDYSE